MSLAEILPIAPDPHKRFCDGCNEFRPFSRFRKTQRDDPEALCSSCRAPRLIPDPDTLLTKVMAQSLSFPLNEEWAAKVASGTNFKVEVVLHIDHAVGTDDGPLHWSARWLEVTRISD